MHRRSRIATAVAALALVCMAGSAVVARPDQPPVAAEAANGGKDAKGAKSARGAKGAKGATVAYAMTSLYWALHETPGGQDECPQGFNAGPREQFAVLYPDRDPRRTVAGSQLRFESETWFPGAAPDPTPFREAGGTTAPGLNLDGQVGPQDFTSPEGERGIDNQMYRALGCIVGFRGPDGIEFVFEPRAIRDTRFNRILIELSEVDDLTDDPDVKVTVYRGLDRLLTDATGNSVIPGGSQTVDLRWGRQFIRHLRGRIEQGVLVTEPIADLVLPWAVLDAPATITIRDGRLRLKLGPTSAEGMIGGYVDVDAWYRWLLRNDSTHHLSNGQIPANSLHKALLRLADAHPDPATGANTAISSALDARFVRVFLQHPANDAAAAGVKAAPRP